MKLAESLQYALSLGLKRIDAQVLHLWALGRELHDRAWLIAHDQDVLNTSVLARLDEALRRRATGEPLAYITGQKEFFGLSLHIDARVLDPRADTETLVEWALATLPCPHAHMLDLGTGSGAIALAVQHHAPQARVCAVDASEDALAVARSNALRLRLPVHFLHSVWFSQVVGRFDVIVSNPPYIAAGDAHLTALQHEPQQALVSGDDGLDDIRTLITHSPQHLQPNGWLLLEHGYDQAQRVRQLFERAGVWQNVQTRRDLAGIERCTGGQYAPVSDPKQNLAYC